MNGLLTNPVIQGLLSGGPNAIRMASEQQRAALAPRGGGGMSGAPGAIVTRDTGMADLGSGLSGLGEGLAAIGAMRDRAAQREVEDQAIAQYLGQIQDPVQKERLTTLAGIPAGRQAIIAGVSKQAFPDPAERMKPVVLGKGQVLFDPNSHEQIAAGPADVSAPKKQNVVNPRTGEYRTIAETDPVPTGYVLAGAYSPPAAGSADKIKLWFGDKSVEVTPGTKTEDYYLNSGYKRVPTLRDGNEDPSFKNEKELRSEVIALNKDFRGVVDQFGRIESAVTKPSPANDIALVFSYMKMLDPTSVVREGEQATVQNAGGVPERVRAQWNRLQSGEQFTSELRQDFYQSARELYERKNTD
jgi:hypothetical protein